MTIATQETQVEYTATGTQAMFDFGFKVYQSSDLKVYVNGTLQVGGYVVNGIGDNFGNVMFTVAPVAGTIIKIVRRTPKIQELVLREFQRFPAQSVERNFDRIVSMVQELATEDSNIKKELDDFIEFTEDMLAKPASVYIGDQPPPYMYNGMRWYNPSVPITYIYYKDGDSGQWVEEASRPVSDGSRISSLAMLPLEGVHGDSRYVVSFYEGWAAMADLPRGGGNFVWNSFLPKSSHNGITVFDPLSFATWDGSRVGLSAITTWSSAGVGCWVRSDPKYHIFEAGGGDGIYDDSIILQRLLDIAPPASTVWVNGAKVLLDSNIIVTDLRTLAGDWKNPDMAGPANAQYFNVATSAIMLNQTSTIRVSQSSSVRNLLVYRKGMTFPTANDFAFAGTAFDAVSSTANLSELLVMGFEYLFKGSGQRYVIDRVFGDNKNGIEIVGSPDVCYISRCHMWPFSANTGIYPNTGVNRSGTAYKFKDVGDWIKVSDCFSYAYLTGYELENVNSMTLVSCSADHNFPNDQVGTSRGFWIKGDCQDIQLQNPQAAAQNIGIEVATTDGTFNTSIMGGATWSNTEHSVLVTSGSARIGGGITLRNSQYAVGVASVESFVDVDDCLIKGIVNPFVVPVGTTRVRIGENIRYEGIQDGILNTINVGTPAVASNGVIDIPFGAKVVTITGTNQISFIRNYYTGQKVVLVFNDSGVVINSGASGVHGIRLQGGVSFHTKLGSTITLMHNGDQWFELSRSNTTDNIQSYLPVVAGSTTAGTGTYTTQEGRFYELGELVFFTASVNYSGHTGAGGIRISLPHNLGNLGERVPLTVYYSSLSVGAAKECAAFVGTTGNMLAIRALDPAGGGAIEFFDAAAAINISGFYRRA
jgi:hypothetical protein